MAVVSTTTYSYVNLALNPYYIQGSQLADRGAWSALTSYSFRDVVQNGGDQYMALQANVGGALPSGLVNANWSILVIVEEQSQSGTIVVDTTDPVARALAQYALTVAWAGTQIGSSAYNYAASAYALAVNGTNGAAAAFAVGTNAYALAVSGTNLALAAYHLAQIGTNTGSAAYSVAQTAYSIAQIGTNTGSTAYSVAQSAFSIAQIGTNTGSTAYSVAQSAFSIAQIGTNTGSTAYSVAQTAYSIAQIGTNTGSTAYSVAQAAYALAQIGTNTGSTAYSVAQSAFSIAQIGTNTGSTAYSVAQSAFSIAQIGTNTGSTAYSVAQAAYALAELGTIIPPLATLPDVNIPTPFSSQVLTFDGSRWVSSYPSAPNSAGIGISFYLDGTFPEFPGYDKLLYTPTSLTEVQESVTIAGSGSAAIDCYISGTLGRTVLDAGNWVYDTYLSADTTGCTVRVDTSVLSGTTETVLWAVATDPIPATSVITLMTFNVFGTATTIITDDRVLVRYYGVYTGTGTATISLYHNGSLHASHIDTPFASLHNDLAGLQGGTAGELYHVTHVVSDALSGAVSPSGTNIFVTASVLQSTTNIATSAYYIAESGSRTANDAYTNAQIGTNTGSAAYSVAQSAWALAQIGTNVGSNAYSTAQSAYLIAEIGTNTGSAAYSVAQSAFSIAQIGTNTGSTAYSVAQSAFSIAQIGTNTGSTAYSVAQSAFSIAQIGTNTGSTAYSVAQAAYDLAQIGTNTGSTAYSVAQSAFSIAQIGTNTGSTAYSVAQSAFSIAQIGTNTGSTAYSVAQAAYALAQIGTNTGSTAYSVAQSAYSLAQIGTNTGTAAYTLAQSGTNKQFGITIGDGATVISTGTKGSVRVPQTMTMTGWEIIAGDGLAGSIVVDAWKTTYAGLPATAANTIFSGNKPTLAGAIKNQNTALNVAITVGDYVTFNVDSVSVLTRAHLAMFGTTTTV